MRPMGRTGTQGDSPLRRVMHNDGNMIKISKFYGRIKNRGGGGKKDYLKKKNKE